MPLRLVYIENRKLTDMTAEEVRKGLLNETIVACDHGHIHPETGEKLDKYTHKVFHKRIDNVHPLSHRWPKRSS